MLFPIYSLLPACIWGCDFSGSCSSHHACHAPLPWQTLSPLELCAQVNLSFFMWALAMVFITPTESHQDTQWDLGMMLTTAFWTCGQLAWLSHDAFCPQCMCVLLCACMCVCLCMCVLVLISGCLTYTYSYGFLDCGTTVGACLEEHLCPRTYMSPTTSGNHTWLCTSLCSHNREHWDISHFPPQGCYSEKKKVFFFFDTLFHWLQMVAIACGTLEKLWSVN